MKKLFLKKKIEFLIDNEELRKSMGKHATKIIDKKFQYEHIQEKLINYLNLGNDLNYPWPRTNDLIL